MAMSNAERDELVQRYADGPARLEEALAKVPTEALQWRPDFREWSVHEIIVHCSDTEMILAGRLRFMLAVDSPPIAGFDQDAWVAALDYHSQPLGPALAAVVAARASTAPLLRALTPAQVARVGVHSKNGPFTVEQWLRSYAGHLHGHAEQIEANLVAWQARTA